MAEKVDPIYVACTTWIQNDGAAGVLITEGSTWRLSSGVVDPDSPRWLPAEGLTTSDVNGAKLKLEQEQEAAAAAREAAWSSERESRPRGLLGLFG